MNVFVSVVGKNCYGLAGPFGYLRIFDAAETDKAGVDR